MSLGRVAIGKLVMWLVIGDHFQSAMLLLSSNPLLIYISIVWRRVMDWQSVESLNPVLCGNHEYNIGDSFQGKSNMFLS